MDIKHIQITDKGEYTCGDLGISTQQWSDLLQHPQATAYLETLIIFLREPQHASSCSELAAKYGHTPQHFNNQIISFSQWVQKEINRFQIIDTDGSQRFWPITMEKGWNKHKLFIWQLRKELVAALRQYLMNKLISDYHALHIQNVFNGNEELYKWKLLEKTANASTLSIIKAQKGINVVDNARVDTVLLTLAANKPEELVACVDQLFDESINLDTRIQQYHTNMRSICPDEWKNCANDERTAAALLTCKYPDTYTFYKDEVYQTICSYFGFKNRQPRKKFSHFIQLINLLVDQYGKRIQQIMEANLTDFKTKPENLAVQTLFWCMKDLMKEEVDSYKTTNNPSEDSKNTILEDDCSRYDDKVALWKDRKNMILYGAPGTGKTYDVPEYVVRLCSTAFDANHASRKELMDEYKRLKSEKRVCFTTFHQSMDYEDWIEGMKPSVADGQITYDIEPGIFKNLCEEAVRPLIKDKRTGIAPDAVIWKVSLAGTGDNPVRSDCMRNNYIRIGWDDYGPDITDETNWNIYNGEGKQILDSFINKMKEGDIVMSCYSSRTIDAIGVVIGEYEWLNQLPRYKRVRKVKWLVKGINEDIVTINDNKKMTLGTVYRLNSISLDDVKTLLDKYKQPQSLEKNTQPYVMVIDELNRGNVSKIFGDLITLLEPDKRKGQANEESVTLPYSKKTFQIPDNVYILATMNTADRSLGTLDYAIRRRFTFIANRPYQPENVNFASDAFKKVSELFIQNFDEYSQHWDTDLRLIPATSLSDEYKPEDVWIGHSYFITGDTSIIDRLRYDIIPLLEEYMRDGVLNENAQETINDLYQITVKE